MSGARKKTSAFGIFQGSKGIALVSKTKGSIEETSQYLQCVFGRREDAASSKVSGLFANLSTLELDLDREIEDVKQRNQDEITSHTYSKADGRLGPEKTLFDNAGNFGTVIIDSDRLGATSPVNFCTVRGNVCVFRGRWCYEVMLGSMGVMQLGWCTMHCKFTQEDGVGDTEDSYSYDGNRVRKWNSKTPCKYGQMWLTGDVITCCMDCDAGTVSFYRNGQLLGEAYSTVRLGPGKAYFPAVSLSKTEQVRVNFGGTPLKYPVEGYRPLQAPPMLELVQAQVLMDYMENIVLNTVGAQADKCCDSSSSLSSVGSSLGVGRDPLTAMAASSAAAASSVSPQVALMLIASHVTDRLAPLLTDAYIVDVCLMSLMKRLYDAGSSSWQEERAALIKLLDLLHSFLQDFELKLCLEHVACHLVAAYRYAQVNPQFSQQFEQLTLTLAILRHEATRKYMLKHIMFDRVKFPLLMHVKPPDDDGLAVLIQNVWWDHREREEDDETREAKESYFSAIEKLKEKIMELEDIQVEMVKLLMLNTDNKKGVSTRFIFLHKFREFLKENSASGTRVHMGNTSPLPACLSFFHRLIRALQYYWNQHFENTGQGVHSKDAFVSGCKFYDDSINYYDLPRLGGLNSHLKKSYKDEVYQAQLQAAGLTNHRLAQHRALLVKHSAFVEEQKRIHSDDAVVTSDHGSVHSLVEILDGIIVLYTIAAHTQLSKMCSLRDNIKDYSKAYEDTKLKINNCPKAQSEVLVELERSVNVFLGKATEQSRQMAWVMANIYTQEKQQDVFWILNVCLNTVERGSQIGPLFTFMPSFYVDAIMDSYNALKGYFHPTVKYSQLQGMERSIYRLAMFFSNHISDPRLVNADTKETIVHALACFVCFPLSLRILETIPTANHDKILRFLLASYDERSWAQTNWILVRLWKGCGFAFRYQHLPNSLPSKNQQLQEINTANSQAPNPSPVLQKRMAELLTEDTDMSVRLIDSVLSQLNWAWSEFIEMLQQLQQLVSRPVQMYVDARQLKICATCFEIAVGLLRTLEMIVFLAPQLLTDFSSPSAELLLSRLCQSLSQVLNRVTSHSNTFDSLVAAGIPGRDTVDHFPVLTALAGILVQLVNETEGSQQEVAINALLMEPSFELSCLDFMLGEEGGGGDKGDEEEGATASPTATRGGGNRAKGGKTFSFKNFNDVSKDELSTIVSLRTLLLEKERLTGGLAGHSQPLDEDTMCDICYARPKAVVFKPCKHQSCKACISHHMMTKKECFFCKASILAVMDSNTGLALALPSISK